MATKLRTSGMMLKLAGILYVIGCLGNKPNKSYNSYHLSAPLSLLEFQIGFHDHDICCPMASGG